MDITDPSLEYFTSKILAPILRKPIQEFMDKAPEPFEEFMRTLPVPLSKPPVTFSSKKEFVEHMEPCLVREAFRSVRDAALLHRADLMTSYDFATAYSRSQKFNAFSPAGITKMQLNLTGKVNLPPRARSAKEEAFLARMAQDDDGQWNIVLVLVMTGPTYSPKTQLGFVHRGLREAIYPGRGRSATRLCLDLWLPERYGSRSLSPGDLGRVAELTPFMSVYRQCWALSMFLQQPSRSSLYRHYYAPEDVDDRNAPLMEPFLSLPAISYRSSHHGFGDQYDEMLGNLNGTQKRVVKDFAYSVTSTFHQDRSFVLGLQGPPGTGKSETIVTLVKLLVKVKPDIKILIAAPSNAAVDSVGRRVATLQEAIEAPIRAKYQETLRAWKHWRVIRLALKEARKKAIEEAGGKFLEDNKSDEEAMPLYPKVVPTYDLIRLGYGKAISKEMKMYSVKERMPMFLKRNGPFPAPINLDVVGNVFLSTLNSSASFVATKIHQLINFDVIIVDEAGQALQLDTLIPVAILGMKKMILIGDQNQLSATVLDDQNIQVDYMRSWLERISMKFENNIAEMLPMLDVQYRMHPVICAFPSAEFYRGNLKTGPKVVENSKDWKLQPLKFFDLAESKESQLGTSKYNDYEVEFIGKLLEECMKREGSQRSYAVITGYEAQRTRLIHYLKTDMGNVRVSTVDGFQGQENEVIIVSCVRAGGQGIGFLKDRKRLNVALTRAQHSVFIVGHRCTLEAHTIWKNFFNQPKFDENVVTVPEKYRISRIVQHHVLKPSVLSLELEIEMEKLFIAA